MISSVFKVPACLLPCASQYKYLNLSIKYDLSEILLRLEIVRALHFVGSDGLKIERIRYEELKLWVESKKCVNAELVSK